MSITTFFENGWTDFLNWLGTQEAAVVAEGKTIIDELVPVIKQDLLADGSALLTAGESAAVSYLATGGNPVAGVVAIAEGLLPTLEAQGISLSKEALTVLAAFISARIPATAAVAAPVAAEPVAEPASATSAV